MSTTTVTPQIELVFKPNPGKQTTFLSLPDTIFEALYGGAAGGGKSASLLILPLLRGWHEHPKFHGLIMRRTFPELEEYMILRSREFYEPCGGKYNEQQKRWRFKSGAVIKFGHCEQEDDIKKYDTAEYNYFAPDELTSFTEFQYRYITFSRVRSSCPDLPAIVRAGTNPGNIGHAWVRKRFVEPAKDGMKILAEKMPDGVTLKRIFIPAKATDNPHITENDPTYITKMQFLPEAEKVAKLYGDWWTFTGQVFEEFRTEPFKDEPEIARHVIDPIIPPAWTPKILAIDWGFDALTYALWGAAYPNRRTICYQEYAEKKKTVDQWTIDISNLCHGEAPTLVALDPSAWQNRGTVTIAQQFVESWTRIWGQAPNLIKADNDRLGGKMLIHDSLRWKPLPEFTLPNQKYDQDIAASILRLRGLEAHKNYIASFTSKIKKEEEILPRLIITKNCKELIKTIPICVYNEKGKNTEDVAEFSGDDPYDDLRYLLKAINYFYDQSSENKDSADELGKRSKVCEELEKSQDMTSFYRKMEFIEASSPNVGRPIRLSYRSRRIHA